MSLRQDTGQWLILNRLRILAVPDPDRVKLERRAGDRGAPAWVAERVRIVLLSAEGLTGPEIARRVGCTEPTVIKGSLIHLDSVTSVRKERAGELTGRIDPDALDQVAIALRAVDL